MQLVDRIEKRRFVGREFLLFLWFESELFDATLHTEAHGSFGLWLERNLVLSEGKESTRITAPMPGFGREAKEALLRGQLPESAGIRIALRDDEISFQLKAERMAIGRLKLQTVLDKEAPNELLEEMMGGPKGRPARRAEPEDAYEVFYERMAQTQAFEELLEALYRDFLALRLSNTWNATVVPALQRWVTGQAIDADAYAEARRQALAPAEAADAASVDASAPGAVGGSVKETAASLPSAQEGPVRRKATPALAPEPALN